MRKRLLTTIGLIVLACGTARAQSLPHFNVEDQCHTVASAGGNYSAMVYGGCMDMEQQAYDSLKENWYDLSGNLRSECERVAQAGGSGSYAVLKGCIEMELNAAKRNRGRSFRY